MLNRLTKFSFSNDLHIFCILYFHLEFLDNNNWVNWSFDTVKTDRISLHAFLGNLVFFLKLFQFGTNEYVSYKSFIRQIYSNSVSDPQKLSKHLDFIKNLIKKIPDFLICQWLLTPIEWSEQV